MSDVVAGPLPIESVTRLGIIYVTPWRETSCISRPGHLIHLMLRGEYDVTANGRQYHLKKNDMLYYYDCEDVSTRSEEKAAEFATVGFYAPSILPPPVGERKFSSTPEIRTLYRELLALGKDTAAFQRDINIYARLLRLISLLPVTGGQSGESDKQARIWWDLEEYLRLNRIYRSTLFELAKASYSSPATVMRSCHAATGISPMKRLQRLRLSKAAELLIYGNFSVTEVSRMLGYPRIHEFSREFSSFYGCPPSRIDKSQLI